MSLAGERGDVVVRQVGAVVHRRRAHLDRELDARPEAELVAVHAQAEARVAARLEHGARLVGVEGALLAEHVDPARVRPARVEHLAADELHVLVRAALVLGRHGVRSEEGHVVGQLGGDGARAALGLGLEPVAGLDLEVGDPRPDRLGAAGARERAQLVLARGAGGLGRDPDPRRRVRPAGHPRGELVGAVAREDEMGVAVHEPRDHAAAGGVEPLVARRARALDALPRARRRSRAAASRTSPSGPSPSDGLARDEQPDVVDDERAHAMPLRMAA